MQYAQGLERMLYERLPSVFHFLVPDYMRMVRKAQRTQSQINFMEYIKSSGLSILWQGALAGGVFSRTIGDSYEIRESKTKKYFTPSQIKQMRETKYDDGWVMPDDWEDMMGDDKVSTLGKYAIRGVAVRAILGLYVFNQMEKIRRVFDFKYRQSQSNQAQLGTTMGMQQIQGSTQTSQLAGEVSNYSGLMVPAYMK